MLQMFFYAGKGGILTCFVAKGTPILAHQSLPLKSSWTPHDQNQRYQPLTRKGSTKGGAHPRCRWPLHDPPHVLHVRESPHRLSLLETLAL